MPPRRIAPILDPALDDQARANLMERFQGIVTANGGMVDRVDEWGRRRLAYAINYKTEGYYILMYITAPAELPRELERNFKNVDSVLRYLVIRFEGALPPKREPFRPREAAVEKSPEAAEAPAPVAEAPEEAPAAEAPAAEAAVEAEEAAPSEA